MLEKLTFSVLFSNPGGGGGNMLCLTLPTFSLSYCKFFKGNPVEHLTRDFEAFNKTLHIAGITGEFEAFSNNLHVRQVLLATLKPSVRPGENYQEGESPTTTLSRITIFSYIYF